VFALTSTADLDRSHWRIHNTTEGCDQCDRCHHCTTRAMLSQGNHAMIHYVTYVMLLPYWALHTIAIGIASISVISITSMYTMSPLVS